MNKKGYQHCHVIIKMMTALLFLTYASASLAGECHFGAYGEGGSSTIINGSSGTPVYFNTFAGYSGMMEIGEVYDASLTPALWSECDPGDDGDTMENITYDNKGADNDTAVWPTNITGIYYAVRVYSDNNPGAWFSPTLGRWESLGVHAPNVSHNWKIQIKLYQNNGEFTGNMNGATKITPKASARIGGMSIGNHTDSNNKPWYFDVTTSSFSIPVSASTCKVATVNNGTNNVDFGEAMFSSIRQGFFPYKAFNLQLQGCNNVGAVKLKVSSAVTGSDKSLLGNTLTSNAAKGLQISLWARFTTEPTSGLVVNDGAYAYTSLEGFRDDSDNWYQVGTNSSVNLPFMADMGRNYNEPLTAGNYKGVATFSINYY
ncbi:fimbrial protein [Enterobacter sp. E-TC7]|uniref:Fimbrial protein n=1 Tax=Enterobacter nematophilus TaxID=2994648 RepID=A0ABT3VZC5_9ENTR|nr:fimbrial protein [Enterobacter nematophilus]MCX5574863.1 fimbrial protein [Enterobacter nematophilus]